MIRIALALMVAVVVVAAITVAVTLLSDDTAVEADLKTYRWCDTVVEAPPEADVSVYYELPGSLNNGLSVGDVVVADVLGEVSAQGTTTIGDATVKTETFEAATAPWPYTDSGDAPSVDFPEVSMRSPDKAAGIWTSTSIADTGSGSYFAVQFYSCDSMMVVSEQGANMDRVAPEDKAAYERLAETVVIK